MPNESERGWGPDSKRGAICVTLDNFGEALELEYGLWPNDAPIGSHVSSTQVLPRLLDYLREGRIAATFFVEGWNGSHYPDDLEAIRREGHEIGLHGWRHEIWRDQDADRRNVILSDAKVALTKGSSSPVGFRPPGGDATPDTNAELREASCTYLSEVGEGAKVKGGVAQLPFRWVDVAALYFEPFMADTRTEIFGESDIRPLTEWEDALRNVQKRALETGDCYAVIFHPYLFPADHERYDIFQGFLSDLKAHEDLWVERCQTVAQWLLDNVSDVSDATAVR